jgi:hypothetical protein
MLPLATILATTTINLLLFCISYASQGKMTVRSNQGLISLNTPVPVIMATLLALGLFFAATVLVTWWKPGPVRNAEPSTPTTTTVSQ